ncbi:MAG: SDR family oxidoreductase [Rhodobacteraceae bacterium]|nr:SDR family oxidoreductase [Paracoccaceae bacterium]
MKLLLTGGTGYLGGFLRADAQMHGDSVTLLGRTQPKGPEAWLPHDLSHPVPELPPADALIHAAFDHLPGRYRGGEGDDPDGFLHRNRDGSVALFDAARRAGISRIVFLSSRAVYGAYPPCTLLTEDLTPRPDTLYGQMKWQVEQALATEGGTSLRVTGVYGAAVPGGAQKWDSLFADFRAGRPIEARQATEVHGADMARAVRLILHAPADQVSGTVFNVSDILLDRRDLLERYARHSGATGALPAKATGPAPNVMACSALRSLGWSPGGTAALDAFLKTIPAG